jgi:hypothetical protein
MWEKKRVLSERSEFSRFPTFAPPTSAPRRGFSPGRMGAQQALARAVTKREQAKQTNPAKDKRMFRQAQRERSYVRSHSESPVISPHTFLEEKRAVFRRRYSIVRY